MFVHEPELGYVHGSFQRLSSSFFSKAKAESRRYHAEQTGPSVLLRNVHTSVFPHFWYGRESVVSKNKRFIASIMLNEAASLKRRRF